MEFIGIDPGFSGGISAIDKDGNILDLIAMPVVKLKDKKSTSTEYDLVAIRSFFEKHDIKMVGLEIQQAFQKQGLSSTFKTGRGFGLLEGMLVGLKIPYMLIKPKQWQAMMFEGLPKDDTKELSALVAQRLYPNYDFRKTARCKNIADGLTDALMISLYIKRIN
jgi:crossover junction endodeoxyribonuclease RuvC